MKISGLLNRPRTSPHSLLSLEGSEWKERRVKLSPIFTSAKMKMMFKIVDSIGDKLVEVIKKNLENNESLEMKEYAGKFTADVIGMKLNDIH